MTTQGRRADPSAGEPFDMDDTPETNSASQRRTSGKPRGLAAPNPHRARCTAHKKNGERCKKPPIRGSNVCSAHGGRAPQVKRKAYERLLASADLGAQRLIEFMNDKRVPYSVRLQATRDLLDRAGLGAAQTVKLGVAQPWEDLLAELAAEVIIDADDARALPSAEPEDEFDRESRTEGSSLLDDIPPQSDDDDYLMTHLDHEGHEVVTGEVVRRRPRGRADDAPPRRLDPDGLARRSRRQPGDVDWGR